MEKIKAQAALSMGEEEAKIFETHIMMLEDPELTGDIVIVDGFQGIVILNPDIEEIETYKKKIQKYQEELDQLKILASCDTITKKGKRIYVAGNIGKPEDILRVIENGGDGVGMCGEMAGDETAIPTLVEYGLDEFSMSASSILSAKQQIMNL